MSTCLTRGPHHIGLTVSKLEDSARFFTDVLGWEEVRRDTQYPAIFVSDGSVLVTLWAVKADAPVAFDRRANVGLHHLAFRVDSEAALGEIHEKLLSHDVAIEFAPQLVGDGPAQHLICYGPSGIRIEFFWAGAA